MSNQHVLKIHPAPLADLISGAKTAEVRRNDRDFQVGDTVHLMEVNPETGNWTGAADHVRTISHIQTGYGLPDGMCVLSYTPLFLPRNRLPGRLAIRAALPDVPGDMLDHGLFAALDAMAAPPAAAPVAAGGPESDAKQLAVSLKLVRRWERPGQATEWEFEVPGSFNRHVVAASEQIARAIVAQDIRREAPPAAAHGDEAVRKDAARYQALRNTPEIFIGVAEGDDMVFLKSPDQLDQLADNAVAMRAQGDGEVQ